MRTTSSTHSSISGQEGALALTRAGEQRANQTQSVEDAGHPTTSEIAMGDTGMGEGGLGGAAALGRARLVVWQKPETTQLGIWKTQLGDTHLSTGRITQRLGCLERHFVAALDRTKHRAVGKPGRARQSRHRPGPRLFHPLAELHSHTL